MMGKEQTYEDAGFFAIIPATVMDDETLPDGARLLYAEISRLAKLKGYCWAKNEHFAKSRKTSERTIIRWINSLRKRGHIVTRYKFFPDSKKIEERRIYIQILAKAKAPYEYEANDHENIEYHCGESDPPQVNLVVTPVSPPDDLVVTKMSPPSGDKNGVENSKAINNKAAAAKANFPEIEKPPPKAAAESFETKVEDINLLKLHFKQLNPNFFFDEAFYPKVLDYLAANEIGFDYISWMYKQCADKKPRSFVNYFFKIFFERRYIELYKEASKPPLKPVVKVVQCPVCKTEFNLDACPCCGLKALSINDAFEIEKHKKLYFMPEEQKKAYFAELEVIYSKELGFAMELRLLKELKIKYGLEKIPLGDTA